MKSSSKDSKSELPAPENSGSPTRKSGNARFVLLALLIAAVCFAGYVIADWYQTLPPDAERFFVGRQSCVECHQDQADLFHGSHHDLAMDLATDETVLADFDGQTIEHFGIKSRVFKKDGKFMVHTEGPDGQMEDFEVRYVFGVTPLQQYMVELEPSPITKVSAESSRSSLKGDKVSAPLGRVQVLRLSWDTLKKKWFYLTPPDVADKLDPNDPLHWTGITQSWNASCAECHSTNLMKNFDPLQRKYKTTFSEIDVSCEACHGPGSVHVELANRKSFFWDRNQGFGLQKLKSTSNIPQINTCAPCHSRRTQTGGHTVGCNFDDHYACQLITSPVYHSDGQIRDEDYVYGSFIQSKMFHKGIKCTDCHDPHSTKLKFNDNRLCTSCHQHPAGKYDTIQHHHHKEGSSGAMCVDCHMPATTYMAVDARRDHSLRIPRPDLSAKHGTPNACTGCHLDPVKLAPRQPESRELVQYLDWIIAREEGDVVVSKELARVDDLMAKAFGEWYPEDKSPPRSKYYQQLVEGNADGGVPTLMELATDRSAPAIFRASAVLDLAEDATEKSFAVAEKALKDPDPKVVTAALMRLDLENGRISDRQRYSESPKVSDYQKVVEPVASLLQHSSRRVRMEAARVLTNVSPDARDRYCNSEQRKAFDKAFLEYRKSLLVQNDRAMSHVMVAGLYSMTGNMNKAMDAYRTAIVIEPNLAGPRANLASILDGEASQLESQLRPQAGAAMTAGQMQEIASRVRVLRNESKKLRDREHQLLRTDLERSEGLPGTHGLHYRYAMSCYLQRELNLTEYHLLEAHRQEPDFADYMLGLATYYQQVGQLQKAAEFAKRLVEMDSKHPGYRSLATSLTRQMENSPPRTDKSEE